LPPNIIEAFKATLEELNYADVLLHVIDASSHDVAKLKKSVDSILTDLKLDEKPTINVFNKIDNVLSHKLEYLKNEYPQSIFISALEDIDLGNLKETIYKEVFKDMVEIVVKVPFNRMDIASYFHDNYEILKTVYQEKEAVYWIRARKHKLAYIRKQGLEVREV